MSGELTKAKLLRAASEAFAEHGFEGASLRKIQAAAGVNSATTHYHFGSKAALYRGVVEGSLVDIIRERVRRMDAVDHKLPPNERLTAYINAYMRPHLETTLRPEGRHYGRILARLLVEPRTPEVNEVFAELVNPARNELIRRLEKVFPYCGPDRLARAVGLIVSVMAQTPIDSIYAHVSGKSPTDNPEATMEAATAFAVAGVIELCGPFADA
ncbi:MAG: TetR/AcrR family transcriptional regulator [Maricaulaceae bacterium]